MNDASYDQAVEITKMLGVMLGDLLIDLLPRASLAGLAGFVVAVVFLMIGTREAWFSREHRIWNLLSKAHYLLWPFLFTLTGCALGATSAVESRVKAEMDARLAPALEANLPALKDFLVEELPVRSADEPISVEEATQRFLQTLYYEPKSDGLVETTKARCINWVTLNFGKWVIVATFAAMVAYALGRAGETLGLDPATIEFTVDTIKEMDFSEVDKNISEIVVEAVGHQISGLFNGFYLQILGLFALCLAVLFIDMLVYHLWWKRRGRANA